MKEVNGIKLYSVAEVAELLGVSKPWIYKQRAKGTLSGVKVGVRGFYFSEESLRDFLNGKTQGREV